MRDHRDAWIPPGVGDADEIHCIPVPHGFTADEAWAEIALCGELLKHRPWWWPRWYRPWGWANVLVRAGGNPVVDYEVIAPGWVDPFADE